MDPEPKGLRSIVLLLTAVVLLSGAVGYLLWWMSSESARTGGTGKPWDDVSGVTLHPVEFLPGSTAAEREKISGHLARLLEKPGEKPDVEALQGLASFGEAAVPRVLDAFYALFAKDGLRSEETQRSVGFLDSAMRRIARSKAYLRFPYPRQPRPDADPSDFEWTAKAWFQWWDLVRPPAAGG